MTLKDTRGIASIVSGIGFGLLMGVLVFVVATAVSIGGCNNEAISQYIQQLYQYDSEIEAVEQAISEGQSKLEYVPMTDTARAEMIAEINTNLDKLERLQIAKGKVVEKKVAAVAQDEQAVDDLASEVAGAVPVYGGLAGMAVLLLGRYMRTKSFKQVIRSVQPLIDKASLTELASIRDIQGKAGKKIVDKLQDKPVRK